MSSKSRVLCYWQLFSLQVIFIIACDRQTRPSHCLAETRELYHNSTKCPQFSYHQSSVECSYKLGKVSDPLPTVQLCPVSNNFPGKPFDLRWSVYTIGDSVNCIRAFNITWRIPQDGSSNYLTGFALHMTYVGLPNPTYVRIFDVGFSRAPDLSKTQFYYDCFPLAVGPDADKVVYEIKLYSLPLPPTPDKLPNHSVVFVQLDQSEDTEDDRCTASWIPRATVIPSLAEATINVTFDPAPNCYHFSAYNVTLVDYDSGNMNMKIGATVTLPRNNGKLQHVFTDVCPSVISVMIEPFINDTCRCLSPASALCHRCTVTSISPVNMTRSRCKKWKNAFVDVRPPTCLPTSTPTPTTKSQLSSHLGTTHLVLAVVGVLIAILVGLVIVVFSVRQWTASRGDKSGASSNERVWFQSDDSSSDISDRVNRMNDSYDDSSMLYLPSVYDQSVHTGPTRKLRPSPSERTI